ncbi:MAG: hypothetical protein Q9191_001281 [Dirinaria sp. TL-2023a]
MPSLTAAADTIRILVATDSHVGYNERDSIRGDDSWKSFHEVLCLAKEKDVDMILLAGDLFHENKPSRKSMYQVMRSLRMNCYGEKPCELEMLSDGSENFQGAFNHVNYEDPDINVSIPVFSIHGNHDDPTGEGHLAALDLLQISGLVNYYGRTLESDNIQVKPVLLQKGRTKLALYGMSNVRDERLFRTFKDGKVKFFQPGTQKDDWFNLMSVHQNHHPYTDTGYLPEEFLPEFLDLVVWGHEHECLIEPRYNPQMGFSVMQPGSSVATSLMPREAVPKHVAVVSVTGKDFKVEPIRLKTVRPFVMEEIVLQEDKDFKKHVKSTTNRTQITNHLISVVERLIMQAKEEWSEAQDEPEQEEELDPPLPLIRLRVEYTAPGGGAYDCENPQRFSNRFVGRVANKNDVVQFYRKKVGPTRRAPNGVELPEDSVLSQLSIDTVKVEKVVREYLTRQSLTILPQNSFGDAVSQFVDKDDKHAMEMFVSESLEDQVKHLLNVDGADDDEGLAQAMDTFKAKVEEAFAAGRHRTRKAKLKEKPANWDSDLNGEWEVQPGALYHSEDEDGVSEEDATPAPKATKGRGKAAAPRRAATTRKVGPAKSGRGKKKVVEEDESEDDDDVLMLDGEEDDESELFIKPAASTRAVKKQPARKAAEPAKRTTTRAAPSKSAKQSTLNFSQTSTQTNGHSKRAQNIVDDISDDDDAFEPVSTAKTTRSKR